MKNEIVHLALKTGFSFKKVFGDIKAPYALAVDGRVGIADVGNSFSHPVMEVYCNKNNSEKNTVDPIYGVRLTVVQFDATEKVKPRGQFGKEYIFLAKNQDGLEEIYLLMKIFSDNFYYRGNVSSSDVNMLSDDVLVIAEDYWPQNFSRLDYIGISPKTPKNILSVAEFILQDENAKPSVALVDNYYPRPSDKQIYELLTAPNQEIRTTPQYIMTTKEWTAHFSRLIPLGLIEEAIKNTHVAASLCEKFKLNHAPMIKYKGDETLSFLCKIGARKRGIDISKGTEYGDRLEYEMNLIKEKDFEDYFLVVADAISWAKKIMLVGPSRGSCAGSLVCYLCGITEVDPIPHDLIFERFIDTTRADLPDIDIDFPDDRREEVIKYLIKKYGDSKVKKIATVSKMKPKIAISEFAKGLRIPEYEVEELKNAIISRSGGDARASMCLKDTLETTEVGKEFIEEYPSMMLVSEIEDHPRHSGVHAAGIIVCNEPIHRFAGVNSRDNTAMVDRKESEYLNLLKIDILGLRTLSVLSDCCAQIGMNPKDLYTLPLDDKKTFDTFTNLKLNGIFQFEGYSLASLTRRMGVKIFEDIVALTSLARPGALYSGGAGRYVKYRLGEEEPVFVSEIHHEITKNSYGIVVYQEQILRICREVGLMSWGDVGALRRALSKSLGKEYFNRYKEKFIEGALKTGHSEEDADFLWKEIENGGAYAFNKSHAVAYGMISYWCAYMKTYHPLEFLVANLRNSRSEASAIKMLREAVRDDGIKYVPVDSDISETDWSTIDGVVYGGLTNIDGIGLNTARKIVASREDETIKLGPAVIKKLISPKTKFDILFPTAHFWGDIFKRPRQYDLSRKVSEIVDVQSKGIYIFIGKLVMKNIRDLNEYVNLVKRGGKVLESNNLTLSIRLEDDTDAIMCNVNRFNYEEIGREIAEHGVVGESWYIVEGEIKYESRYVEILQITELTEDLLERD